MRFLRCRGNTGLPTSGALVGTVMADQGAPRASSGTSVSSRHGPPTKTSNGMTALERLARGCRATMQGLPSHKGKHGIKTRRATNQHKTGRACASTATGRVGNPVTHARAPGNPLSVRPPGPVLPGPASLRSELTWVTSRRHQSNNMHTIQSSSASGGGRRGRRGR